ncbi:hypothetical protein GCM10010381_26910 [Streptomyces xantholiticus]|nr:hypothetical protein GCM10010381_26910 [Streptomyces xantholiticus]
MRSRTVPLRPAARHALAGVKTVQRHRANLLRELGLRDRPELTRYAVRAGLIEP